MYQRLGDAGKAIADFTKALELCRPVDRALAHFSRAQVLLEAANFDSAILDFTSSIQANPMGLGCYQMRGQAFYGAGRFDSAISDFTYVIEKRPSDAEAYAWRGHCYGALGRERAAFQDFEHADKLGCDFSDLQTRLHADSPGAAALERFLERTRDLDRTSPTPPPPTPRAALQPERHRPSAPPPITPAPPAPPGKVRVDWGDWTVVGKDLVRQYDFQNLPFAERLMLQIRLTVEMGSFGFPHTHPHMIMQPPISEEQEITRTIVVDSEDGSVEAGPLQVTISRIPGDASLIWFSGDTYKKFLAVLWSMKRIRFLLLEPDGRAIQMALPLETGPDYRDAFSRIQNQVTGGH
jgi:hypothetical protein